MEALLAFLAAHADVISLIAQAVSGGTSKEALVAAIKAEMVGADRAEVKRELGL